MSVRNAADHVEEAVRSILDQTFHDLEFIVIDDGSTDDSSDILDDLAADDWRLRVIHQQNIGLTRSLVRGCGEARGKYIARQDARDTSHRLRLAEQVHLLDCNHRLGFISCASELVGPEGEHLMVFRVNPDPAVATRDFVQHSIGPVHGSVLLRKNLYEKVGGYRPAFYFAQDIDLWLRLATQSLLGTVPQVRYSHRRVLDSTSSYRRAEQVHFGKLSRACHAARVLGQPEDAHLNEAVALTQGIQKGTIHGLPGAETGQISVAYVIGSQLVKNRDFRAGGYLWRVVRKRPLHWKAWVRLIQALWLSLFP